MHWIFKTEGQRENFLANVSLKTNLLFRVVSMKSLQDEFSKITAKQCWGFFKPSFSFVLEDILQSWMKMEAVQENENQKKEWEDL